jgi:threonine dehydratase
MIVSLEKGVVTRMPLASTLADGIAVREVGSLTIQLAKAYVDEWTMVNEELIANAVLVLLENEKIVAEGAGAAGLAALINRQVDGIDGKVVVCVISGGNIDVNILDRIIMRGLALDGRIFNFKVEIPDKPGRLAALLDVIRSFQANILEIDHHREFNYAPFGFVQVDITLETRGHEQIREIEKNLEAKGYHVVTQRPSRRSSQTEISSLKNNLTQGDELPHTPKKGTR